MQTVFFIESYFRGKKYKKNIKKLSTAESAHSEEVSDKTAQEFSHCGDLDKKKKKKRQEK